MIDPVCPVIETENLVLRRPSEADLDACAAFYETARAFHVGDRKTRPEAWRVLAGIAGHWALRGWGMFVITRRGTEAALGIAGPWRPEGWPEHELGWTIWDAEAEGTGLATEAARTCRRHAYGDLGWKTAVSYIAPGNARSIALAQRLGAVEDPDAPRMHDTVLVFRHPAPESLQ